MQEDIIHTVLTEENENEMRSSKTIKVITPISPKGKLQKKDSVAKLFEKIGGMGSNTTVVPENGGSTLTSGAAKDTSRSSGKWNTLKWAIVGVAAKKESTRRVKVMTYVKPNKRRVAYAFFASMLSFMIASILVLIATALDGGMIFYFSISHCHILLLSICIYITAIYYCYILLPYIYIYMRQ